LRWVRLSAMWRWGLIAKDSRAMWRDLAPGRLRQDPMVMGRCQDPIRLGSTPRPNGNGSSAGLNGDGSCAT